MFRALTPAKTITPQKITNELDYACVLAVMLTGTLQVRAICLRAFLSGILIATMAVRLNVFSANAVRRSHKKAHLPIEDTKKENACGYIFKGSSNMIEYYDEYITKQQKL